MNTKRKKILNFLLDYIIIAIGAVLYALSVNIFTAPNNIAAGGLTGVSTMLNYLYGLPIGVLTLIMNIPLFIWGAIENGRKFLTKTIVATILATVFIDLLNPFVTPYSNDVLLAALFGGILSGAGLALIFYRGGTTGGVDIIARNINNHFPHISMGNLIFMVDAIVIISAGFVYGGIESSLYPVITIFVSVRLMDSMLYGFAHNNGKLMFIVSDKYESIRLVIIAKIERGVTMLDAEGGYNNNEKKVIMCAVRSSQVHKINVMVRKIDPNAFVMVTTANTISGNGFETKK